jgi:small-conductance mechanosensitive channel
LFRKIAAQIVIAGVLLVGFVVLAPRLRRALVGRAEHVSLGATRQILMPLAVTAPWVVLLLVLWFATLVAQNAHLGIGVLRLAESLALAWVIIKLSSSLVSNENLARALAVSAFIVAALNIAGMIHPVIDLLDSMAISVGTLRLSVLLLLKGALILALFLWIAGWLTRIVDTRLHYLRELTPAMHVLISKLVRFTLLTLAVVLALGSVGIDLTAFAVFTGAVGVGIGFGLQKIVSNLVSGVILLLDRSIKPGDVIEMDGSYG